MSEFTPNQEAVRRISAHLLGEDMRNVKAAVESFPNGYTVLPLSESTQARAASVPPALDEPNWPRVFRAFADAIGAGITAEAQQRIRAAYAAETPEPSDVQE